MYVTIEKKKAFSIISVILQIHFAKTLVTKINKLNYMNQNFFNEISNFCFLFL